LTSDRHFKVTIFFDIEYLRKFIVVFWLYPLHSLFRDPFRTLLAEGSVIPCAVGAFRFIAARTAIVSSLSALGADFSSFTCFFAVTKFLAVKATQLVWYIQFHWDA